MANKTRKESQSSEGSTIEGGKKQSSGLNSYWRVFGYADSQSWLLFAIAFVAAIGAGVPLPLMDLVFGQFVTAFNSFATGETSPSQYMDEVTQYTLYFIYLFVGKFVLVYIHTVCVSIAAIRVTKALRIDFLKTMLRQEIAFFDSKDAGSPSVKVTTTANLVNQGISEKLSLTIQGLSTFATAFILAFAVQWKLTLITISIVPTILIVTAICVGIDAQQDGKILSIYSQAGLLAEEVFASITTVHAFWLQPVMRSRYDALLEDAETVGWRKSPNWAVMFSIEFFCIYSGYGLAFWQGIRMYTSGEIEEAGKVVTVIFAIIVAATALTQLAPQFLQVSKAISASNELFETIDRVSNIDALSEDGLAPKECKGDIEVQDLEFAYPARPDEMILRGLNLKVPAGKTTALVGASGSGKSTIIGLLERWYEQSAGRLMLEGVDIRDLNIQWLRTHVRLVQQEPVLFNGTIFENVAHGLIGTPLAELPYDQKLELVEHACRDAFAHDFIVKFPKRYDTPVGERARMLSGGQKQRIAIARSIISNPPILLLDEATSALDPKAEGIVQRALDNVSSTRTTLVIAHKLSTIQKARSIAVMAAGRVIEQGTHRELLDQGGAYSRLVKAQDLDSAQKDEHDSSDGDDDDLGPRPSLTRTKSEVINTGLDADASESPNGNPFNYNLVTCVWKLLLEQKRLWPHFILTAIACIAGGAVFPAQAYMFAQTFEAFQLEGSDATDRGDFWALMFFVVAIGNLVVYGALGWLCNTISQTLARIYRRELFTTVLHQDMAFFDLDNNATGALVSRLSDCATNLQELLQINVALILINVVNVVSSSIFGIAFGWKLGLVCVFGALPPLIFSGYIRIRLEFKLDEATSARFASSAAVAAEAVSAIRTVASLTLERNVLQLYQDRLADVATKSTKALLWTMIWYSLSQSINFLAMALGFWYGGKLVSDGEYTTTQFFAIFIAVIFGGEAAAAFFQYSTSLTKAQTAANLMFWLRRTASDPETDSTSPEDDEKAASQPVGLDFDSLTFAYPTRPNTDVLQGIDVNIPPGSFAAFVGPSGCGKSTTISLLERFYEPTTGSIKINNAPLTAQTPRNHRSRLALVQQEPTLYQGSIRDNIALGSASHRPANDAQIQIACRQANILDFVQSLPEGLDTPVGGRGSQLSGRQRQRIAIARALIRDPRILLLDEATSALDTESERMVQAALSEAAADGRRTTVAVAHRLSTIRHADCIFVFEAGRIVEAGTHGELVAEGGRYADMCLSQALDQ